MRPMRRTCPGVIIAAALWTGGCSYAVRLFNEEPRAVTARLVQTDPVMPDWVLAERRVEAGEVGELSAAKVWVSSLILEVEGTHETFAEPARRVILPGQHGFAVRARGPADRPRLALQSRRWWDLRR